MSQEVVDFQLGIPESERMEAALSQSIENTNSLTTTLGGRISAMNFQSLACNWTGCSRPAFNMKSDLK